MGNEHELVKDVDTQTLIKLVKFRKRGKVPGPDTIHNVVLRLATSWMENSYPTYVTEA